MNAVTEKTELEKTIIELWHISKTALATKSQTKYDRMIYIKNELQKSYPSLIENMSSKKIWLLIENQIN
jgi:ATP-dependent helicase/DNAse subunit B